MSALLTDPTVVLVVSHDRETAEAVRTTVDDGAAESVERVADASAIRERIRETPDVGCVLVSDRGDPVAVADAVGDVDRHLPVVAVIADGSESLSAAFSQAGGYAYVVGAPDDDDVGDVVEDAMATCRRRRREAMDASILDTIFEDVGVAMYAKDRDGRYVRAAKVPGGRSPELLRGQTDLDVYGDEDPDGARDIYEDDRSVVEDREPIFQRRERLDLDTGEHYSQTTKVPWLDEDGDVLGLVGLSLDVTDVVHQEERLARQEERIDEFASYVSHDLRSPLQVATGALELARESGDEAAFERLDTALGRIDDMIDDLSALAKEGQAVSRYELDEPIEGETDVEDATRIVPLIDEVWSVVRDDVSTLSVAFGDEALVTAPETSVRPVLENLFQNAVVHAGPDVHVEVGPIDDGGFYVEDDGPGVAPADRDAVFEHGYTTAEEGSGTGLHIVSDIADRHTWDLGVTEGSDGGARFEIRNCLLVAHPDRSVTDGDPVDLTASTDVGDAQNDGRSSYDDALDRWTVSGGGRNIWHQDNEFHFVHADVDGPVRIQARIVELDDLREYTKAGVMVRGDLTEAAPYGYVGITPGHGTELLWRNRRGEDGISQHVQELSLSFPWYRVDRVGETVTTWLSADGEDWHPIDQRRVALDGPVHAGLVVCSYTPNRLCEAVFEDVTVLSGSSP